MQTKGANPQSECEELWVEASADRADRVKVSSSRDKIGKLGEKAFEGTLMPAPGCWEPSGGIQRTLRAMSLDGSGVWFQSQWRWRPFSKAAQLRIKTDRIEGELRNMITRDNLQDVISEAQRRFVDDGMWKDLAVGEMAKKERS